MSEGVQGGAVAFHVGLLNLRTGPDLGGMSGGRVRGGVTKVGPRGQEKGRK